LANESANSKHFALVNRSIDQVSASILLTIDRLTKRNREWEGSEAKQKCVLGKLKATKAEFAGREAADQVRLKVITIQEASKQKESGSGKTGSICDLDKSGTGSICDVYQ
jgi:hypothetical protein